MKSIFLNSLLLFLILFSGCSQKAPEVEPVVINKNTPVQPVEQISTQSSQDVIGENAINGGSIDDTVGQLQTVQEDSSLINQNNYSNQISSSSNNLEPVYFEFDKYTLNDEELDKATDNARVIKAQNISIRLEGNCDEWGSDEYNFALGLKRAKSVKEVLIASGISRDKITLKSNGEANPVCTEHNEACWKKNRRVDFIRLD